MVDASITAIDRGTITADRNNMLEADTLATATDPNPALELVESPVYNLVIDHPEGTILWDTGSHPDADSGHWPPGLYAAFEHTGLRPIEDDLDDAGYAVSDIDSVIQSHLHLDHAGGLYAFEGTETPIFVHERELKHAYYSAKTDRGDIAYLAADFDRELNWRIVHGDREQHFKGIEFIHLPGHTPGLLGVRLDLDDAGVVFLIGDQAYLRENYDDERPMGGGLMWSKRAWIESLQLCKDEQRRHDARVFCGHDPRDFETLQTGI